jgi:hypothetical protein
MIDAQWWVAHVLRASVALGLLRWDDCEAQGIVGFQSCCACLILLCMPAQHDAACASQQLPVPVLSSCEFACLHHVHRLACLATHSTSLLQLPGA